MNAVLGVIVAAAGLLELTRTVYDDPVVAAAGIVAVSGEAVPVVASTVPGKAPAAVDSSTVNTLPATKVPVVVKGTEMLLPAQAAAGLTAPVVIVCANEEAAARTAAMHVKSLVLINVFFMYPSNIYSLTCSTGKVRDIFQIHSYTISAELLSFPSGKYILHPESSCVSFER